MPRKPLTVALNELERANDSSRKTAPETVECKEARNGDVWVTPPLKFPSVLKDDCETLVAALTPKEGE